MSQQAATQAVRRSITVAAPLQRAFEVFTEGMSTWWPLATHKIGASPAQAAVVEGRVGGRWFERGDDGSECDWGRILVWEPPHRVVFAWQIDADWHFDPELVTEVEIRFIADSASRTRVELEHRDLAKFGSKAKAMRSAFESPGGWAGLLARFGEAAARS